MQSECLSKALIWTKNQTFYLLGRETEQRNNNTAHQERRPKGIKNNRTINIKERTQRKKEEKRQTERKKNIKKDIKKERHKRTNERKQTQERKNERKSGGKRRCEHRQKYLIRQAQFIKHALVVCAFCMRLLAFCDLQWPYDANQYVLQLIMLNGLGTTTNK